MSLSCSQETPHFAENSRPNILSEDHCFCRNQGTELERLQQQNTKFGSNRWCELSSSSDVSIIKVNASVPVDSVSGFKALLKALEDFPAGKVYVTTEVPIICSGVISNAYAALRDEDTSFVIPEGVLGEQEWTEYLANRSLEANDIYHWRNYLKLLLLARYHHISILSHSILRITPHTARN